MARNLHSYLNLAATICAVALAGCLLGGCGRKNGNSAARASGKPAVVEALIVTPQLLRNTISTTGTLLANEEVTLRPEISGRVIGVYFQEGKRVAKGDLLLKINDAELKAQLRKKEVEEKQASDEESRKRKLFESKSVSQEEYDRMVNALRMIQAEKEAIQSQLAETEIRAPFDGMVGLRSISEGAYVTPDVSIATLQNVTTMKVEFAVPEKHAQLLKSGTEVVVHVGESSDGTAGTVYAVESKIDPETRTIKARARIGNAEGRLIPGSFAKVEITLEQLADALVVPSEAVIPGVTGETVFLCRNGKAVSVPVKSGTRTETSTQITAGLSANDTLIVTGILQLTDGKAVQIATLRPN